MHEKDTDKVNDVSLLQGVQKNSVKQIVVGVCAMAKKSQSKPMHEILKRLKIFEHITIKIFSESVILEKPVLEWPHCDCLISFQSSGFPLQKAVDYAKLHQPFLINDIESQFAIQDRRIVYQILQENGIKTPRYAVYEHCSEADTFEEYLDHIVVGTETFYKPFVEKPVNADDHNIHIYYPSSAGGGCQKLHRKIGDCSSLFSTQSSVRRIGSYIYEDFIPTDGTDIKVYTVGPEYAHAEARKSPALDGIVDQNKDGQTVRIPVILTIEEKLIAKQVCLAFKQTVCGFDFLRANGKSFVCDVNGFSFVKNSMKYYDDCAKLLGNMITRYFSPHVLISRSLPTEANVPVASTTSQSMVELRCVIAVTKHGDKNPIQKMEMEVRHKKFFDLFQNYNGHKTGKLKLKRPRQLQEILDIARWLLTKPDTMLQEKRDKVEQLKDVLEMYGHFSGINRKVQLKYRNSNCNADEGSTKSGPSLLLILNWGGELTPAGRWQAEKLGQAFRCMYPGDQGDYASHPGCGLLSLHSTYQHDLKIYASDEGRVQMTAAAFAKGFLALEGELTSILAQKVKSANMNGLLDNVSERRVKSKLQEMFNKSDSLTDEDLEKEYGLSKSEKMDIALGYCVPLLRKIKVDLQRNFEEETYRLNPMYSRGVLSPGRHVKTRLYFTSESHIHSFLTVLQYGGLCDEGKDGQWKRAMDYVNAVSELNYMTQIVIMLYENPNKDPQSEDRFHIELHFSPGAKSNQQDDDFPQGEGFCPSSQPPSHPLKVLHDSLSLKQMRDFLDNMTETQTKTEATSTNTALCN